MNLLQCLFQNITIQSACTQIKYTILVNQDLPWRDPKHEVLNLLKWPFLDVWKLHANISLNKLECFFKLTSNYDVWILDLRSQNKLYMSAYTLFGS